MNWYEYISLNDDLNCFNYYNIYVNIIYFSQILIIIYMLYYGKYIYQDAIFSLCLVMFLVLVMIYFYSRVIHEVL